MIPPGPDTIFAVASGWGRAAIAIVRLSGSRSAGVLQQLVGALPPPRRASLRTLRDPGSGEPIDRGLVLWMPGPATFTGEDQAELHLHGGLAVRAAAVRILAALPGCRAAEPGEFTRRAFLNGRLDLTAVEGLADLIDAETEAQRRQALRQLEGELAGKAESWRDRLADALALCEASLDFSDEEDVPLDVAASLGGTMSLVRGEIGAALAGAERGERLREGYTVVIAGPPNAGKSTLLNALARRDVAIVSPTPGTTRDLIEVRCDLDGIPVTFVDTAGLRASEDEVEREGVARATARMRRADLVLWLSPLVDQEPPPADIPANALLVVASKSDLSSAPAPPGNFRISAATGRGLEALLQAIAARTATAHEGGGDALVTRERHRLALSDAAASLDRALTAGQATELVAEDLRLALRALGRLIGQVEVEQILDRIFASFCIGK